MTRRILAISAGLSDSSATTRLARGLAEEAAARMGARVDVVELRPFARDIADAMVTGFPSDRLNALFESVAEADAIVAVSPVYNSLPSGLYIEFFDVLPEGTLEGKPVAIGATGGSPRHSLVTEQAIRPMFVYLHAAIATTAVYAATEDWGAPGVGFDGAEGQSLIARMAREGRELARLAGSESARFGAADGLDTADGPNPDADGDAQLEFPDFVPFPQLLGK